MASDSQRTFSRAELEQLALFASANLDALEPVLRGCLVRTLEPGEILITLGSDNRQLFLILAGELEVHLEGPQTPALTKLGVGETVGEISVIDRRPASVYVVAEKATRVLVLDEEMLWLLADSSHAVAYNLLTTLASRLRGANQIIQRDREQIERYKWEVCVDSLTGLFNRYWIDKMMARQMARARVGQEALALLLLDVDHFKQFNDRHGHIAGDCALRAVAACMREIVRPTDLIARFGGEEFVVLLPGAELANAREVAERLRQAIASMPIAYLDGSELAPVTVSIGAAQLAGQGSPEAFLEQADRALYRAKNTGRNRVEV